MIAGGGDSHLSLRAGFPVVSSVIPKSVWLEHRSVEIDDLWSSGPPWDCEQKCIRRALLADIVGRASIEKDRGSTAVYEEVNIELTTDGFIPNSHDYLPACDFEIQESILIAEVLQRRVIALTRAKRHR